MELVLVLGLIILFLVVTIVYLTWVRQRLTVGLQRHLGDALVVVIDLIIIAVLLTHAS